MAMKKQETFTDIEYSFRKKKTKREEFLEIMDEIIPWDEWVSVIEPYEAEGRGPLRRGAIRPDSAGLPHHPAFRTGKGCG